ncbi:MAG TPA: O-antigen ligase family protein, partial [Segetibacter sp.]|nr:O-antigen ligase family protein [Segetibacter sp.]
FLTAFAVSCVITVFYLDVDALRIIRYSHLPFLALFSDAFINQNFSDAIDIHPTYLSMYVALSIVCMLTFLFSQQSIIRKMLACSCIILLSVSLLQLGSKSVLIAFLFLMMLSPLFLHRSKYNKKIFFLPALILVLAAITIFQFKSLQKRFISNLVQDVTRQDIGATKNEYRIARWQAAVDLIKQSPVIGFGTASEIKLLKKKYFERRLYNSFINELNAHNQYLSVMIKAGVLGLVVFLYTLYYGFTKAIKSNDFVMFSFLVIVTVVSFSENILEVNKGIFYYSFFFSLFVLALPKERHFSQGQRQPLRQKKRFYYKRPVEITI